MQEYRDARDAVDALRESGTTLVHSGTVVAWYQLEPADQDAVLPRVTFKQWLIGQRHG